ncbi:MAG TPA: DUF4350 domain-containing protein [Baekduia sp.]|uniref:DUF4350 domain-containing protein n=1 Tax=Baekduia sp. TaxID=2600305 RepID=UPI002C0F74C5|nr:DUF4350 domain-containing protein [Baekduia sp.]HMJ35758.1 DUF4350 domain-containing protein [Baekduia sp.]
MTARTWAVLGAVAVVVAAAVLLGRAEERPSGPASSSYATTPGGLAAYAELLERAGHQVRRIRAPLDRRRPARDETLVLVDGRPLPAAGRRALVAFLNGGGRAVLAGRRAIGALGVPVPSDSMAPALRRVGRGEALLLADPAPLRNRALATGDHAAVALGLAGPPARRVAFVESVHGYHEARGLGALPGRVQTCLALLALAALVFLAARGRRLGPPEALARELPPPRRAHVDALAAALARTRDREELLTAARQRAATTTTTEKP